MDILSLEGFLQIVGIATITIFALAFISFVLILIIGYVLLKKNRLIFPNLALFLMDNFHSILLRLFLLIGTEETFYRIG